MKVVKLLVGDLSRSRSKPTPAAWACSWTADGPALLGEVPEEADVVFSITPEDASLVRSGALAPSVAFMQGRLKTSGDNGLVLEVLAWTATPAFAEALTALG